MRSMWENIAQRRDPWIRFHNFEKHKSELLTGPHISKRVQINLPWPSPPVFENSHEKKIGPWAYPAPREHLYFCMLCSITSYYGRVFP